MDGHNSDERFPPTSGRVLGVIALAVGLGGAASALVGDDISWGGAAIGIFFAGLAWSALLRPGVAIEADELVLRNMLETVRLPLAAVEEVVVRQVLAVRVGEKRFTSPAVGRPRRQMAKDDLRPAGGESPSGPHEGQAFALFVQDRIRERSRLERERLGIRIASAEQDALSDRVRRTPAVLEITWLSASFATLVALLVL